MKQSFPISLRPGASGVKNRRNSVRWLSSLLITITLGTATAEDWPQWRGPGRTGAVGEQVPLRGELPENGLLPVWMIKIPGGSNGGWGSPVVADGRVLLTTHVREKKPDAVLPDVQFPPLSEQQKVTMAEAEQQAYEQKRQDEQRLRREQGFVGRETLLCVDAETGTEHWRSEVETQATRFPQSGTPAVENAHVYTLTADRVLRCLDLANGNERWSTSLPTLEENDDEQTPSSVLVVDGLVVVFAGPLTAVDASTGELRWQNPDLTNRQSSPAVWSNGGQDWLVANTADGKTHLVSSENGHSVWSIETGASRSSPVVVGDLLVTAGQSRKHGIRAWRLAKGNAEALWAYQRITDPGATPAVSSDWVYAVGDKRICCLDAKTGEPIFEARLDIAQPRYTSPIATGDHVLYTHEGLFLFAASAEPEPVLGALIGEEGRIASEAWFRERLATDASDPKTGAAAWDAAVTRHGPLDCASPAFADGHLYLRLKQGLACYDLRG